MGGHYVREFLLESRNNPGMNLLPSTFQQSAIRRVLHEGMLEGVIRFWRYASPKNQFGTYKLSQSAI